MSDITIAKEQAVQLLIKYNHFDCPVNPEVEWFDLWDSAVDGTCPACGMENIVAVSWIEIKKSGVI